MGPIVVERVPVWMAFLHGILAFLNPCIIPLIPFFLSVLLQRRGFGKFIGFAIGFCGTFTAMGFIFSCFASFTDRVLLSRTMGVVIIVLSVLYAFEYRFPGSGKLTEIVIDWKGSGFLFGTVLAVAWMPCSSPVLVSALSLMSECGSVAKGVLMMFLFSLGILTPFLITGRWISDLFGRLPSSYQKMLRYTIAVIMITFGAKFILS